MPGSAVKIALTAYLQPSLLRGVSSQPFPDDTLDVIRVAAGDDDVLAKCAKTHSTTAETLRGACVLYLRSAIIHAGKDNYRLLLLPTGASAADVKTHSRWLLKWLHPDLNKSAWESALFLRVRQAAKDLERGGEDMQSHNALFAPPRVGAQRHKRNGSHKKMRLHLILPRKPKLMRTWRAWFANMHVIAKVAIVGVLLTCIYFATGSAEEKLQVIWTTVFG